jgi:hypothetical protein
MVGRDHQPSWATASGSGRADVRCLIEAPTTVGGLGAPPAAGRAADRRSGGRNSASCAFASPGSEAARAHRRCLLPRLNLLRLGRRCQRLRQCVVTFCGLQPATRRGACVPARPHPELQAGIRGRIRAPATSALEAEFPCFPVTVTHAPVVSAPVRGRFAARIGPRTAQMSSRAPCHRPARAGLRPVVTPDVGSSRKTTWNARYCPPRRVVVLRPSVAPGHQRVARPPDTSHPLARRPVCLRRACRGWPVRGEPTELVGRGRVRSVSGAVAPCSPRQPARPLSTRTSSSYRPSTPAECLAGFHRAVHYIAAGSLRHRLVSWPPSCSSVN